MKIALGGRPFTAPYRSDPAVALAGAGHRPAHGLRILGGQIAGYREEIQFPRAVHDGQLASLELVRLVRENLVDHIDHRIATHKQNALLAIARETHVVPVQCHRGGNRCRLLARAFHVETGFSLPLLPMQPVIEGANLHHGAEHLEQRLVIQIGIPWADRLVIIVQHPDHVIDHVAHIFGSGMDIRSRLRPGLRNRQVAIINLVARPESRLRHVQAQWRQIAFVFFLSHQASPARIAQYCAAIFVQPTVTILRIST